MNQIKRFESMIGGRWTGITFHREVPSDVKLVTRPMYFCEAVRASSTGPLTLTKDSVSCPGGRRSLGWTSNGNRKIIEKLREINSFSSQISEALIHKVPRISNEEISAVTVGTYDSPDILVSYLQPETAMRFISYWQSTSGENLPLSTSSIMAVCGSVAAGVFKTGQVRCSFGCSESRLHGHIGRGRLIMGFPTSIALSLV